MRKSSGWRRRLRSWRRRRGVSAMTRSVASATPNDSRDKASMIPLWGSNVPDTVDMLEPVEETRRCLDPERHRAYSLSSRGGLLASLASPGRRLPSTSSWAPPSAPPASRDDVLARLLVAEALLEAL